MKHLVNLCIGILFIFLYSCKKDRVGCWQGYDPAGLKIQGLVVCKKTKSEAEAMYPRYWFYKEGEKEYCWRMEIGSNTYYVYEMPESITKKYMEYNGAYKFTKINCNSFCHVNWLEKHQSKTTGLFNPTKNIFETFLSADTCSKLNIGRIIVYRETADSLITREVWKKAP
jgi:hypothetical protein